jgi:SAM-dependent methyltransferase
MAYGQFARHFLLPLLLYRKLGVIPTEVFLTNRDGITPHRAYKLLGAARLWSRASLELVLLPKWLTRAGSQLIAENKVRRPSSMDAELAKDLSLRTLRRLRSMLSRLSPNPSGRESVWEDYEDVRPHYSEIDLAAKKDFVSEHLEGRSTVLDLGCNAGEFSLLSAEGGREVVAADADHSAVSRFYARVRGRAARVSPLMLNISRPTPAVGWENRETPSFLERAVGKFDCILVLGLVHHLLVSDRITLPLFTRMLDQLEPKSVIIEWVDPTDPRFIQVAGLNADLYQGLNAARFEECLGQHFSLAAKQPLQCKTRVMYLWLR